MRHRMRPYCHGNEIGLHTIRTNGPRGDYAQVEMKQSSNWAEDRDT